MDAKMPADAPTPAEEHPIDPLRKEMTEIIKVSKAMNEHLEIITSHRLLHAFSTTRRILMLQFLRGTAFGLGRVVGATIVVYILSVVLSKMEFVPILGDLIERILQELEG